MDVTTLDAGILDDFQGYIVSQLATAMGLFGPYHQFMYGLFIFIVICLLGAKITRDIGASWLLITKLIMISVFVWFTTNWVEFTDVWSQTMVWAGTNAGGNHIPIEQAFSSGTIFAFGMKTSGGILRAAFSLSILTETGGIFIAWFYVGAAILTLFAFGFLAIQVFVATTLFQLIILIGLFLLPFGIWKKTAFIVEPVFGLIAGYGVSMMVLAALSNVIVGYGEWVIPRLAEFSLAAAGSAAMFSLCSVYLAIYARKVATEMISGAPSMGAEEALNTIAASTRALAGTVAAAGLAGMAATAAAGAATKSAQAAMGQLGSGGAGKDASISGTASTGSAGASGSVPEIGPVKAAGAMHARFSAEMSSLSAKSAGVAQSQNAHMGSNVQSLGLKRIAREMQGTVGQSGGLSESAAENLKSRMEQVQSQHTANVKGGMPSDMAAGIAEGGYQKAVNQAMKGMSPDSKMTLGSARESVGMHSLSSTTQSNDVMMASKMGIVGQIQQAALEGKSTRETMESLGDKMKPIEDAAVLNGAGAEADVHKMGIINSVRETMGVPSDKEGAKAWAAARSSSSSGSGASGSGGGGSRQLSNGGVARTGGAWDGPPSAKQAAAADNHRLDISGMTKGEASLALEKAGMEKSWNTGGTGGKGSGSGGAGGGGGLSSPSNTNVPSVPNWLKKTAGGRIMPNNTNGHGGYRSNDIIGD